MESPYVGTLSALSNCMISISNYGLQYKLLKLSKGFTAVLLFLASCSFSPAALSQDQCSKVFTKANAAFTPASAFLLQVAPQLHMSRAVNRVAERYRAAHGKSITKPVDRVTQWLQHLDSQYNLIANQSASPEHIKSFIFDRFVIKASDVPESYFQSQIKLARERGYGEITLTKSQRHEMTQSIIQDQQQSLEVWLDYFLSNDSSQYPTWAKYWALMGLAKMSKYSAETRSFGNRTKDTVAPFPELNREAFALVVDVIQRRILETENKLTTVDYFIKEHQGASFSKYYSRAISRLSLDKADLNAVDGIWIKYPKGSDHTPLVKSLQGKNTGWCTAAAGTAQSQLSRGDFYVFYSYSDGKATQPRVAIRMENDQIAEVRGVGKDQNLDAAIAKTDVVEKKLNEFGPDKAKKFKTKTRHMSLLTEIEKKIIAGQELNPAELSFLHEFDEPIEGFGYKKDPRISKILKSRNKKADLAEILSSKGLKINENEISLTTKEALSGQSKYHFGDLEIHHRKSLRSLKLPQNVSGNLTLVYIQSAQGLTLPETVGGNLKLKDLTSAEGLKLPRAIGKSLIIDNLSSAQGLTLPEIIQGDLSLNGLKSPDGLVLPKTIGGNLLVNGITSAHGLILPETILGSLYLNGLISSQGLKLPVNLGQDLFLASLTSAEGLTLPKALAGSLHLSSLPSAEALTLPETIEGHLFLTNLLSAKGVTFPRTIGKSLILHKLTSPEGLILPETVGWEVWLSSLITAKGLRAHKALESKFTKIPQEARDQIEWY